MAWARAPGRAHTHPGTIILNMHDLTNHIHPLADSDVHIPLPWTPPDPSLFENTKSVVPMHLTDHTDPYSTHVYTLDHAAS
jgi:hypothetical protein